MTDIRGDDEGFLVGDGEHTDAEGVLLREIKTDTSVIVNLLKGTAKVQRDALKATQSAASPKPKSNAGGLGQSSTAIRVNLNRSSLNASATNQDQRVNLVHPDRISASPQPAPARNTARPNILPDSNTEAPALPNVAGANGNDVARLNRDRRGRFTNGQLSEGSPTNTGEGLPVGENRDSRGRFTGGGSDSTTSERSAVSQIADGLKDLSHNITLNADTSHIDPMVDAIKEAGGVVGAGVEAGRKAFSVSNTLVAKPAMALGRGIKGLFKPKADTQSSSSPVTWYKRIWRTLTLGNRQAHADHNQEQRRLDDIARGQGEGGGGNSGLLMMLGLGLAALIAALKNFKFPGMPTWPTGMHNSSPIPVMRVPKVPPRTQVLPPTRTQNFLNRVGESRVGKFVTGLSETKIGKAVGGLVKKLPVITSLMELGAGGINAVNINNNKDMTDAEKERAQAANAGRTAGAIGGGLGGAAVGAAIGTALIPIPVLGTIVGGIVGSWLGTEGGKIVGEKVGGWVDDLANADIAGRMDAAWQGFITPLTPMFASIKDSWKAITDAAAGTWESVEINAGLFWKDLTASWDGLIAKVSGAFEWLDGAATKLNSWVKDKTGVDVADNLKRSKDAVIDTVSRKVVEPAVNVAAGMAESVKIDVQAAQQTIADNAGSLWQGVKDAPLVQAVGGFFDGLLSPTSKELGALSAKHEGQTGTVARDNNGANAYGKYQFNAGNGGLKQFFAANPQYQESFKGLDYNSEAFKQKWQSLAKTDKGFEQAQDVAARKMFFEPLLPSAQKAGFKLDNRGVQEALFSASINHGQVGNKKIYSMAAATPDFAQLSPEEQVKAFYKARSQYVQQSDIKGGQKVKDSLQARYTKEGSEAIALAKLPTQQTVVPKAVTSPVANQATQAPPTLKAAPVSVSPAPNVQAIPSVQAQQQPLRVSSTPQSIKVTLPKPLVGQNVNDRGIAHIITGGIGEA